MLLKIPYLILALFPIGTMAAPIPTKHGAEIEETSKKEYPPWKKESIAKRERNDANSTNVSTQVSNPIEAKNDTVNAKDKDASLKNVLTETREGLELHNEGKECWNNCNKITGRCNWCGSGSCCRIGYKGDGCSASTGCPNNHCCTKYSLVRHDGKCGPQNLIDGKPGQCNPYGNSPCCSPKGYCGITVDHCRGIDYRVKDLVRKDGRCGPDFPINGKPGQCSPYGNSGWCCSPHVRLTGGWCGSTWNHCKCANCIDYRKADKVVSLPHNKSLLGYDDRKYLPRPAPELGQKPQPPASLRPLEQEPQPPTSLRPVEQEPQPPTSL